MDKPLRDLLEIIQFTEKVSAEIHGLLDEAEIYRTVKEEFVKSKRYNTTIMLLTDDETKLRIVETTTRPKGMKIAEKLTGLQREKYRIDVSKSSIYPQVVREGKTIEVNFGDIIGELFPRPLANLLSKVLGLEKTVSILTPLKQHGKIIGVLAVDSISLAEHFIPTVKNITQHISTALELAEAHTLRKQMEAELKRYSEHLKAMVEEKTGKVRESEGKYRNLVERANDGIVILQDMLVKYANPRLAEMTGYTVEETVGKPFTDYLHPDVLPKVAEYYKRRMAGEKVSPIYEVTLRGKEGNKIDIEVNAGTITYQGKPADLAVIRNITERKQAEETLRESEERYRSFFRTSRDGVFITSKAGELIDVNDAGVEIFSYRSREELMKKRVPELYAHPEERKKVLKMIEEQGLLENYPVDMKRRDGAIINTLFTFIPRRDGQGAVVGYQGVVRNVTAMRRAQQALEESEERHRDLIAHMYEGLYTIDAANNLTFANPRFAEMLGYPPEELIGKPVFTLFPEEEVGKVREELKKRGRGVASRYELNWITRKGDMVPTLISASPTYRGGKHVGSYVVVTDLTEHKRLEEERLKVMGETARSIGHDIRNPLQAIRNAAYILREAEGEKRREMAEMVDRNVVAADRIVQNLIDFSSAPPLQLVEGGVNHLLQVMLAETLLPGNVKLTTHYGSIPPAKVDMAHMTRVFQNLAMNAVQAMPKGGELSISTGEVGGFVEVKVRDTGVGIPEENLKRLFHPFFTTKAKGTGLGLTNARSVVEAHGGTITVESEEGKGTTFTVRLPITTASKKTGQLPEN